jgi:prephenate dehydrogenase
VAIDPEAHDRMLAGISHLPHVVANALVTLLTGQRRDEGGPLPRIGPSFRDATRVAGANPDIWTDIFMANREQVLDQVRALGAELAETEKLLAEGDRDAVTGWIERVGAERAGLVETQLAAGEIRELRLTVPNRPGIVAEVALALGNAGVNIADMALAPAADMRTGAISLWIAGGDQAGRARGLIEGLGFPVAEA